MWEIRIVEQLKTYCCSREGLQKNREVICHIIPQMNVPINRLTTKLKNARNSQLASDFIFTTPTN